MDSRRNSFNYASIAAATMIMTVIFAYAIVTPNVRADINGLAYYANDGSNFVRSSTPFSFSTADYHFVQTVTPGGGIVTTLTPLTTGTPYADFGFAYTFGKLGDITSIPIVGTGSYSVNIWIDMNTADDIANGPFFSWSGNTFTGQSGDTYGLGPAMTGSGTITTGDSFFLMLNGNSYTIAQLQSGVVPGIDGNTIVGFWFGIINHAEPRTFEIDLINGQPLVSVSPPVGGEWLPANTIPLLLQIISYSAALSAIVASFVGFKRLKKKQN